MMRDQSYLAYELRDGLLQDLLAVGLLIEGARRALGAESNAEADALLERAARALQGDVATVRAMIDQLRPAA